MDIIIPKRSLPRLLALTLAVFALATGLHARSAWAAAPPPGEVAQEGDDPEPPSVINTNTCGDSYCDTLGGEDVTTCAEDCSTTCGDEVCNRPHERADSCPADCPATCGDGYCEVSEQAGGPDACPEDCPATCGDGVCDGLEWHGEGTCTADCATTCGDGYCDVQNGENSRSCQADCRTPDCGDGVCTRPFENAETCATGCGPTCGDGFCDASEFEGEVDECLQDCPTTCGDGLCEGNEWLIGAAYCGTDCTLTCGDGFCNAGAGETAANCDIDCRAPDCGDGVCTRPEEDLATCAEDCTANCGDGLCTTPNELPITCADCVPAPLAEQPDIWRGSLVGLTLLSVIGTSWALAANINRRRKVGRGPNAFIVLLTGIVGIAGAGIAVILLIGFDTARPPTIDEGVTLLNCVCDGDTLICDGEEVGDDHPACGQGALASGNVLETGGPADPDDVDEADEPGDADEEDVTDADDPTSTPPTGSAGGGGTTGGGTGGEEATATLPPTCGNGICDVVAGENSDLCNADCQCTDDGFCAPGEGLGCADCGETAGGCGNVCQFSAQCGEGLQCVNGRCFGSVCDEQP